MAFLISPLVLSFTNVGAHLDTVLTFCAVGALLWGLWRKSIRAANDVVAMKQLAEKIDVDQINTLAANIGTINDLVNHELNHNSGSSIKDKAYRAVDEAEQARREASRAADAAETAAKGVQEVQNELRKFMLSSYDENRALWRAIDGVKNDRTEDAAG